MLRLISCVVAEGINVFLMSRILQLFLFIGKLLMLRVLQHLLVVVVRRHRLRLLVDEHVVCFELLSKSALYDAAHALELATKRFQLGTARRYRLLQWKKKVRNNKNNDLPSYIGVR